MKNVHFKLKKVKIVHRPILLKAFHHFIAYQLFKMKNMVSKEQKIKEIKVIIGNNPSLNSSETLRLIQSEGLGIRKQEFQTLFREQRQLPEPTKEKKEKSVPIKFRKGIGITPIDKPDKPKKEGQYGVIEVIDNKGNSFWIKYQNKKDFNRQLEKIKSKYSVKKLKLVSHGFRNYVDFIDKEFREILETEGIIS